MLRPILKICPIRCASVNELRVREAQLATAVGLGTAVAGGAVTGAEVADGVEDNGDSVGVAGAACDGSGENVACVEPQPARIAARRLTVTR